MKSSLVSLALVAGLSLSACNRSSSQGTHPSSGGAAPSPQTQQDVQTLKTPPVPPVEKPAAAKDSDPSLPEDFQKRPLLTGQQLMDVPKFSPNSSSHAQSELTIVSCEDSETQGAASNYNGIILLKGAKAVLVRDLNYHFGDGTMSSGAKPYSYFTCSENTAMTTAPSMAEDATYQNRDLHVGDVVMEVMKTSPQGGETRSVLTLVSCIDNPSAAATSGVNGVNLLKGSKMVIIRDTNYQFGDGSNANQLAPVAVISCE